MSYESQHALRVICSFLHSGNVCKYRQQYFTSSPNAICVKSVYNHIKHFRRFLFQFYRSHSVQIDNIMTDAASCWNTFDVVIYIQTKWGLTVMVGCPHCHLVCFFYHLFKLHNYDLLNVSIIKLRIIHLNVIISRFNWLPVDGCVMVGSRNTLKKRSKKQSNQIQDDNSIV